MPKRLISADMTKDLSIADLWLEHRRSCVPIIRRPRRCMARDTIGLTPIGLAITRIVTRIGSDPIGEASPGVAEANGALGDGMDNGPSQLAPRFLS